MRSVASELHDVSLRFMRRLMHCMLLLPPRSHLHLKLLYTISILIYLGIILHWRLSFNYQVTYDVQNDNFSLAIDLLNFVALIVGHCVVSMELLWRNRSEEIEQKLERIRYVLRMDFGRKVNLVRIRRYCKAIYSSLFLCCLMLSIMTIFENLETSSAVLLYYAFYSEIVLLTRLCEFSLYSTLIFAFYLELRKISFNLILELERARFEVWSLRRLSLQRLSTLQQLHGLLWSTVRSIEGHFELSLLIIMLKYFVDTSVLPYWMFLSFYSNTSTVITIYCSTEEFCKLFAIVVPCLICTRCDLLQRQFRSMFHNLTTDRRNPQLNSALLRISAQLGQERCHFSAGGLFGINNDTLGKFIFGMASYIVICIQFRISFITKASAGVVENAVTDN